MGKLRKRMSFSRINEGLEMPDLIEVQKRSYQRFLETDLKEVLADASPITNYNGNLELTFTDYSLGEPKNSVERCRERDMTYAAPLNIHVHLYDSETSEIKETDVYMGDFPLMTENGTFVINGADRVIVSQLVRSPGCYYTRTLDKAGVPLYSSQIIPNRGAWLEYETDSNDIIWVRLDRARKLCLTTLLRALGYETDDDIRNLLGNDKRLEATMAKDTTVAEASKDRGGAVRTLREQALLIIYKKQKPDEPESVESATNMFKSLFYDPKRYDVMRVGRYKFNKKLSIATRINKHIIAEDMGVLHHHALLRLQAQHLRCLQKHLRVRLRVRDAVSIRHRVEKPIQPHPLQNERRVLARRANRQLQAACAQGIQRALHVAGQISG